MTKIGKLALAVVVSASLSVSAQQITGNIRGTVSDPTGAVVASATVIAQQIETGLTRSAVSDHAGTYLILELPVGPLLARSICKRFPKISTRRNLS